MAGFPIHSAVQLSSLHMEGRSANFSDVAKWRALRRFVRERKVGVLVDVDVALSWYSLVSTLGLPVRVISWEHFHYFINVGDAGQRWRRSLARWMAVRRAHALVTLTQRDRQQYLKADKCKVPIVHIPNPVTILVDAPSARAGNVVLAAGRLVPQKGFDRLLDAWALIAADVGGWRLRVVGSGPEENALRTQSVRLGVTETVEFVPSTPDMSGVYRDASIYAMSSRFEGLPLVLIEAKSFGLPIVSFDCACGPSDIVRDGVDGLLVQDGDVAALAAALRGLILDKERRDAFGEAAREDRRFEPQPVVERWERLLGCHEYV